jgi:K+-sensing histidine kinase KdpD
MTSFPGGDADDRRTMARDRPIQHDLEPTVGPPGDREPGGRAVPRTALDQESLLGVLSHELRTPVTTIYGGAQMLATHDLPEARRKALASDVGQEAERLFRIVEDLVTLLRSERGEIRPVREPVAVGRVIAAAVEHELARNPGLRIRYLGASDAAIEEADEVMVVHAVRNLLDNAIRYTTRTDPIEIVVDVEGNDVTVRVLDRGPAPDAQERTDIIHPEGTEAGRAGGGLGLFVAARLINAMDGRSWARPRSSGGAEFGFALPRSPARDRPARAGRSPQSVERGGDDSNSTTSASARSIDAGDATPVRAPARLPRRTNPPR